MKKPKPVNRTRVKAAKPPKELYCGNAWCGVKLPGPYGTPGVSLARADNKTLLCSDCGVREALARMGGPLVSGTRDYRMAAARRQGRKG